MLLLQSGTQNPTRFALLHRGPPHIRCTTDAIAHTVSWSLGQNPLSTRPACRLHPLPLTRTKLLPATQPDLPI
ncbi:hypothetical protein FF1_043603 [Malus domestica]